MIQAYEHLQMQIFSLHVAAFETIATLHVAALGCKQKRINRVK